MGLALGQAVVLELLYQLVELHPTDVIRHTPQGALRRIGNDARGLGIDQLVVVLQTRRRDLVRVIAAA